MLQILTAAQMQRLSDKYNLRLNLEDGVIVAARKDGRSLRAATVAKMLGIKKVPSNWTESEGTVRGL